MLYSELFAYYRDVCAPAIAKLEGFYAQNPEYASRIGNVQGEQLKQGDPSEGLLDKYPEIHNEIRMAFTHLCRTALSFDDTAYQQLLRMSTECDLADYVALIEAKAQIPFSKDAEVNLDRAKGHLRRACMDAVKCLYIARMKKNDNVLNRYIDYSVEQVHNGNFFETVSAHKLLASKHFEDAKIAETIGKHDMAIDSYRKADDEAKKLEDVLDDCSPSLEEAKQDYLKSPKKLLPDILILVVSLIVCIVSIFIGDIMAGLEVVK